VEVKRELKPEDVMHALHRLEWLIYEAVKPGVEASEALIKTADTLRKLVEEAMARLEAKSSSVPQGIHKPYEVTVVGTAVQPVVLDRPAFSISLVNDGPDPVLPMINLPLPPEERVAWIKSGETLNVKWDEPTIHEIFLVCEEGKTATVRIHTYS